MLKKIFHSLSPAHKVLWHNDQWINISRLLKDVRFRTEFTQNIKNTDLIYLVNQNDYESIVNILMCLERKLNFCLVSEDLMKNSKTLFKKVTPKFVLKGTKLQVLDEKTPTILRLKKAFLMLFTSSISPKAVIHDASKLIQFYSKRTSRSRIKRITILTFPLDHMGGLNLVFKTWMSGGCVVLPKSRTIGEISNAIVKTKTNTLPATPTLLRMLLLNSAITRKKMASLRTITYGAEMMDTETLKRTQKFFTAAKIFQTYGLTEVGVLNLTSKNGDDTFFKFRDLSKKMIKVKNGILYLKTPNFFIGYFDKKLFKAKIWFSTFDLVERRKDDIKILGRVRDVINVAGLKAYPIEIESVLLKIPFIQNVQVYKEKCPLLGERVVADIVLTAGHDPAKAFFEVRDHCIKMLEKHKIPQKLNVVAHLDYSDRFKRRQTF